jgi:hypothetical protein
MTITLNPGCFGSALTAQRASETCQNCSVREQCFTLAQSQEPEVLAHLIRKLTARGEDTLDKIKRYLSARKRLAVTDKSGNARSDKLLARFLSESIDLSALRNRRNPFNQQVSPLHFWMADFIVKGFPFKPKDMTEHIQANCTSGLSTQSIKSEVARFASAMVSAGILERKDAYILCLRT